MDVPSTPPTVSSVPLDGPSIRLRPLTRADYGFLWRCRTHPDILYLWMHARTLPTFEQYAQELDGFLASQVLTMLLIETQSDTPKPVGYIFAYDFSGMDQTAFVSIVVHPTFAINGWAAEAAMLFFNYLFAYFDLRKAQMDVFAFNHYLLGPLTQIGVRVEGRFTAQRYYQGRYHDVVRLAVMHEDWNSVAPEVMRHLLERPAASQRRDVAAPSVIERQVESDHREGAPESAGQESAVAPARKPKRARAASANGASPHAAE